MKRMKSRNWARRWFCDIDERSSRDVVVGFAWCQWIDTVDLDKGCISIILWARSSNLERGVPFAMIKSWETSVVLISGSYDLSK